MASFKYSGIEYARRVSDEDDLQIGVNLDLELIRLRTFANSPEGFMSNFSLIRLAQAGFYFESRDGSCRCFSCAGTIRNESGQDPQSIHRTLYPSCRFIRTVEQRQRNTINTSESNTERNTEAQVRISSNVDTRYRYDGRNMEDTYLKQGSEVDRTVARTNMDTGYSTFSEESVSESHIINQENVTSHSEVISLPLHPKYSTLNSRISSYVKWEATQSIDNLAEAGFFYTGSADGVRCFHCGISLMKWEPDDNPWIEHVRWSPNCSFLIKNKPTDVGMPPLRKLNMQAIQECASNVDTPKGNSDLLADCIGECRPNGSTQIISEQDIEEYMGSVAVQAVLELTTDRVTGTRYVKEALDCLCLSGYKPTAVQIYSLVEKLKKRDNKIREAEREKEQCQEMMKTMNECGICRCKERCMVFCPCGHCISCEQCARVLQEQTPPKCPTCRSDIIHSTKIFWP